MDTDKIQSGIDMLRKIPNPVEDLSKECLCSTKIPIFENTVRLFSGVINYSECLCPSCRKEIQGQSKIVCVNCKNLLCYVKPTKHKTGFMFEADKHYHVAGCPKCVPNTFKTSVLELERYCAERNIPTQIDVERVAEYEKKAGKMDQKASELKATLIKRPQT